MSRPMTHAPDHFFFDLESDSFTGALGDYAANDVKATMALSEVVKTVTTYRRAITLSWIDASFRETGTLDSSLHKRGFDHLNSAIAWARKQIAKGLVYGDSIEMELREANADNFGGEVVSYYDITLKGAIPWGAHYHSFDNRVPKEFGQGEPLKRVPLERDKHRKQAGQPKKRTRY